MPDSSPVASGCRRSCSMMYRSIVTTDVAVCLTTVCGLRVAESWNSFVNANRWTSGPRYRRPLEVRLEASQLGLCLHAPSGNAHGGAHLQNPAGYSTGPAACGGE